MVALHDLWLPILLAAVFVFLVSSVIHMALQVHKKDYQKMAHEEEVLKALRQHGVAPGEYVFPCAGSMKEMGTPEMLDKMKKGPVGFLTVVPSGAPAIGKNLVQWFVFSLVIGAFTAYVATLSLERGDPSLDVFRLTGTVAILGYAFTNVTNSIWKGVRWSITAKFVLDGIVYGLATAAAFAWLWPGA